MAKHQSVWITTSEPFSLTNCFAEASGLTRLGSNSSGLAYLLAVAFIVLYLGEHHVIDLAAALALAEAVRRADPLLQTLARAVPVGARCAGKDRL